MSAKYDPIFEWNMTRDEAETFKIAIIWEEEVQKLFPGNYRIPRLPANGDPRRNLLFRHCWKFRRETRGLLKENQYRLYIHANLVIIKEHEGLIEPNCICGEKAWIRWKVFERLYNKKLAEQSYTKPTFQIGTINPKILKEIDNTKRFLFQVYEGEPTFEKLKQFVDEGIFRMWVYSQQVSPFYLVQSPHMQKIGSLEELAKKLDFDHNLYLEKLDDNVKAYFRQEFAHEF